MHTADAVYNKAIKCTVHTMLIPLRALNTVRKMLSNSQAQQQNCTTIYILIVCYYVNAQLYICLYLRTDANLSTALLRSCIVTAEAPRLTAVSAATLHTCCISAATSPGVIPANSAAIRAICCEVAHHTMCSTLCELTQVSVLHCACGNDALIITCYCVRLQALSLLSVGNRDKRL